jgi:hypothetical protein
LATFATFGKQTYFYYTQLDNISVFAFRKMLAVNIKFDHDEISHFRKKEDILHAVIDLGGKASLRTVTDFFNFGNF